MVKHDDYMTPFSAWEDVSAYIPHHLTLWEAFYGDGTSGAHLAELGFDVIHEDIDFFEHDLGDRASTAHPVQEAGGRRGGAEWAVQLRLPVLLLATRVAEGRGVLDVMAVSTLPSKMRPK